jgi:hypothetical protein
MAYNLHIFLLSVNHESFQGPTLSVAVVGHPSEVSVAAMLLSLAAKS